MTRYARIATLLCALAAARPAAAADFATSVSEDNLNAFAAAVLPLGASGFYAGPRLAKMAWNWAVSNARFQVTPSGCVLVATLNATGMLRRAASYDVQIPVAVSFDAARSEIVFFPVDHPVQIAFGTEIAGTVNLGVYFRTRLALTSGRYQNGSRIITGGVRNVTIGFADRAILFAGDVSFQ